MGVSLPVDDSDLLEELDILRGMLNRKGLTEKDDLSKVTSIGSMVAPSPEELREKVGKLDRHLDETIRTIREYRSFLERNKGRI